MSTEKASESVGMLCISAMIKQNSFCFYPGHGSTKFTFLLCHILQLLAPKISGITYLYRCVSKPVVLSRQKGEKCIPFGHAGFTACFSFYGAFSHLTLFTAHFPFKTQACHLAAADGIGISLFTNFLQATIKSCFPCLRAL